MLSGSLALPLLLAAGPEVWVATEGYDASCSARALVAAVSAQRPQALVRVWAGSPPENSARVRLVRGAGADLLELSGAIRAQVRQLPASVDCERSIETAALIVDGALDELTRAGDTPEVDSLLPWQKQIAFSVEVGGAALQAPWGGVMPAVGLDLVGRYHWCELFLAAQFAPGGSTSLPQSLLPESGEGSVTARPLPLELGVAAALELGPGRFAIGPTAGTTFWFGEANGTQTSQLSTAEDLFVGARLSYTFELTRRLLLGLRFEERYTPQTANLVVTGASSVNTRTWVFDPSATLGWRFF